MWLGLGMQAVDLYALVAVQSFLLGDGNSPTLGLYLKCHNYFVCDGCPQEKVTMTFSVVNQGGAICCLAIALSLPTTSASWPCMLLGDVCGCRLSPGWRLA